MSKKVVYRNSVTDSGSQNAAITIPAGGALAVYSAGGCRIVQWTNYPTLPAKWTPVYTVPADTPYTTSTYTNGATLAIEGYGDEVYYEVGTAPIVQFGQLNSGTMPAAAAGTLNATGTLTAALMLGQVVTSTTAAAVTATLATGPILDAATSFNVGDFFEFTVVNTGGTNAFTVSTASGWTLVGSMAVAANTSGTFRVLKTAAGTFTIFRC